MSFYSNQLNVTVHSHTHTHTENSPVSLCPSCRERVAAGCRPEARDLSGERQRAHPVRATAGRNAGGLTGEWGAGALRQRGRGGGGRWRDRGEPKGCRSKATMQSGEGRQSVNRLDTNNAMKCDKSAAHGRAAGSTHGRSVLHVSACACVCGRVCGFPLWC